MSKLSNLEADLKHCSKALQEAYETNQTLMNMLEIISDTCSLCGIFTIQQGSKFHNDIKELISKNK